MKVRGLYTQKRSPFYWLRYYDKLEPDPKKKSKSICTKIEISSTDRRRIEEAALQNTRTVLKGTPEVRIFAEAFRKGLNDIYISIQKGVRLAVTPTLTEAYKQFKTLRSVPGKKDELKQKTILTYNNAVDHFITACGDREIITYNSEDFNKLLQHFDAIRIGPDSAKRMSTTSRSIYVRCLKSLWNYFLTQKYTREQIFEDVRVEHKDPEPIPLDDMWKIISFFKQNKNYPNSYFLVRFLFLTGCRVSSAMEQLKEDIDFEGKSIRIMNVKTGQRKQKGYYLFPLYGELEYLLHNEMKINQGDVGRVFSHFALNHLQYAEPLTFWRRAMGTMVAVKHIRKRYTLKQIRSTTASYLVNNLKFDIYRVQKLLDHSNVKVTEKNYVRFNVELVRQVLDEEMKHSRLLRNAIENEYGITEV
jgi:integrase